MTSEGRLATLIIEWSMLSMSSMMVGGRMLSRLEWHEDREDRSSVEAPVVAPVIILLPTPDPPATSKKKMLISSE